MWTTIALIAPAQIHFEFGGGGGGGDIFSQLFGGGGQRQRATEWPADVDPKIEPVMGWLANTEWSSSKGTYTLLKGGVVQSSLKECKPERSCLWAANHGEVLIITPKVKKPMKFKAVNPGDTAMFRDGEPASEKVSELLAGRQADTLQLVELHSLSVSKSGRKSKLQFSGLYKPKENEQEASLIAEDLYKVLDVAEDAKESEVKSRYRRLSVQHHPDKGGDVERFNVIREAYEVLSDKDKRKQYNLGGMLLVKNMEMAWKEVDGQKVQLEQQLAQIPKNHPMRAQAEAQIAQQTDKRRITSELDEKMTNNELVVSVPCSLSQMHHGGPLPTFVFERLVICRGCRAEAESERCKQCGACPPEKRQVGIPGPIPGTISGTREEEVESAERCRKVPVDVTGLSLPSAAKNGQYLKKVAGIGHQTPGKFPGVVRFQAVFEEDPQFAVVNRDLYTVLEISVEDALWGFNRHWNHFDGSVLGFKRSQASNEEVFRVASRGLSDKSHRGDLFIRVRVGLPASDTATVVLNKPTDPFAKAKANLTRESEVEIKEGAAWRRWTQYETAKHGKPTKVKELGRDEL